VNEEVCARVVVLAVCCRSSLVALVSEWVNALNERMNGVSEGVSGWAGG
jgi:hypothetical protein